MMISQDIVGKRVKKVVQGRVWTNYGTMVHNIQRLLFEDGTELDLSVAELEDDYAVIGRVDKKPTSTSPK